MVCLHFYYTSYFEEQGEYDAPKEIRNQMARPSQILQLFDNLMSNSLKYARKDADPVISIKLLGTGINTAKYSQLNNSKRYHHITFSDNGIGFDKEHVDRIFKIFQRLHGQTEYDGTGIGLSICRKIVEAHQGYIYAEKAEDAGAIFNIFLPASS